MKNQNHLKTPFSANIIVYLKFNVLQNTSNPKKIDIALLRETYGSKKLTTHDTQKNNSTIFASLVHYSEYIFFYTKTHHRLNLLIISIVLSQVGFLSVELGVLLSEQRVDLIVVSLGFGAGEGIFGVGAGQGVLAEDGGVAAEERVVLGLDDFSQVVF